MDNVAGGCFPMCDHIRVTSGIVDDDKDVFVTPRLTSGPEEVHANLFEGDALMSSGMSGAGGKLMWDVGHHWHMARTLQRQSFSISRIL